MGLFGRDKNDLVADGRELMGAGVADDDYIVGGNPPEPIPTPVGNRVIIRPDEEEERTASGLLIKPDTARDKPTRGTVLAVGEELGLRPVDPSASPLVGQQFHAAKLMPGDRVLFGKYAGFEFEHEGESLLIVRYDDILAVYGESEG